MINSLAEIGRTLREYQLPVYMHGSATRYLCHGIRPGGFLTAVITNDLREAVSSADDENLTMLVSWVQWFYNEAPALSWGSEEAMDAWVSGEGRGPEASPAAFRSFLLDSDCD
jgi:hypothetical protein